MEFYNFYLSNNFINYSHINKINGKFWKMCTRKYNKKYK